MSTLLFVYGTLKRGERNHHLLADQRFVGEGATLPRYRLFTAGRYPCLVEDAEHGQAIRGEVWAVDDDALARLDEFEDAPDLFERSQVHLAETVGPVSAYIYRRDVQYLRDCGDWWTGR